jgi:hypothetical protein
MMRRTFIALLIAAAVASVAAAAGSSGGHTAGQLENAGWQCLTPPNDNVHCTQSLAAIGVEQRITFKVFHVVTGEYLGTELLVHEDSFKGEPCPTDPPSGEFTYLLPILGIPYYACHRYDSPF